MIIFVHFSDNSVNYLDLIMALNDEEILLMLDSALDEDEDIQTTTVINNEKLTSDPISDETQTINLQDETLSSALKSDNMILLEENGTTYNFNLATNEITQYMSSDIGLNISGVLLNDHDYYADTCSTTNMLTNNEEEAMMETNGDNNDPDFYLNNYTNVPVVNNLLTNHEERL